MVSESAVSSGKKKEREIERERERYRERERGRQRTMEGQIWKIKWEECSDGGALATEESSSNPMSQ